MPASELLTDTKVHSLKPKATQMDYRDTKGYGLLLRVSKFSPKNPTGKKEWQVRYTDAEGKDRRAPIGEYFNDRRDGHMGINEARARSYEIRDQRKQGIDPVREAKKVKLERAAIGTTLKEGVELFLADILPTLKNDKARAAYRWHYDSTLYSFIPEDTPLADIQHATIYTAIQKMKVRAPVGANRFRNKVNVLFKWLADPQRHLINTDPTATVKKPTKEKHRAADKRRFDDLELKFVLRAVQTCHCMEPEMKNALRFIALTSRRPQEVCGLKFSYIKHWDKPDEAYIEIPAALMKTDLDFLLPITPELRDLLDAIIEQRRREVEAGRPSDYLFQSRFYKSKGDRPITPNGVAQAMERLLENLRGETEEDRAAIKSLLDPTKPDVTPYAFRRTVGHSMSPLGISREDIKAVMAHLEEDVLAMHYNAYDRMAEKRAALTKWGAHVTALETGARTTGAVLPFRIAA